MMDSNLVERIKHRASELWQVAGAPEGRDEEFWLQAEKEIKGETETYERLKNDPTVESNS
jgi:hypothetical protein